MDSAGKQRNQRLGALSILVAILLLLANAIPAMRTTFFLATGVVATIMLLYIVPDHRLSRRWRWGILFSLCTVPVVAYLLFRLLNLS